jgi:hypothetical protein
MMASSVTEPPPAGPTGKSRKRSAAFIAAFVAFQFLVPLTYLLREDSSDERFTWRSLSAEEPGACLTSVSLWQADGTREAVPLEETVHPDWAGYVAQGRRSVVDAVLRKECAKVGVAEVELINHCGDERGARSYQLRCDGAQSRETIRTAVR